MGDIQDSGGLAGGQAVEVDELQRGALELGQRLETSEQFASHPLVVDPGGQLLDFVVL